MTKQYEVRELNTGDLFKMTKILSKVIGDIRKNLGDEIENVSANTLGMVIVESATRNAQDEFIEFLSDLVGLSPAEFEKLPFDTPLVIIEQLAEQEDLRDFFTKARNLVSKIGTQV